MTNGTLEAQFGLLLSAISAILAGPEVNTTFGPVAGVWLKTKGGLDVSGFLGLPYADPPVGDLRFENPRPWSQNWTEVRNAIKDGPECLKISENGIVGDEDCLNLNIFTPMILNDTNEMESKKLPVLVFVHGDAFNHGSSNSSLLAPTYLLDHDIILVTLNYRVNALGFFSTGNDVTPGNYGLKDIAAALLWVKNNVEAFGGDPDSVTLVGSSSGAAAVQLLASSPATQGLFHKLVTMSGSAAAPWAVHSRERIRRESMRLARLLGCDDEPDYPEEELNDELGSGEYAPTAGPKPRRQPRTAKQIDRQIVECVRRADARQILDSLHDVQEVWQGNPLCIFGPTLEAEAEGAILTVHPVQSLKEGLFRDVPWIIGVVDDEGLIKTDDFFLNSQIKDELIQNFEDLLVPYVLEMDEVFDNVTVVTQAIEDFYFNNSVASNFDLNITQLVGDAIITWPTYDFLQKQVANMKSNVYLYSFAYQGTFSNTFRWGYQFRFGVAHNDDLNYLFPYLNAKYADLQLFNTLGDITMINVMCEMMANFVKTGVPSARLTVPWEPYQKDHRYMRLGSGWMTDRSMRADFLPERMSFWAELMANHSVPIKEHRVDSGTRKSGVEGHGPGAVLCLGFAILWAWRGSLI